VSLRTDTFGLRNSLIDRAAGLTEGQAERHSPPSPKPTTRARSRWCVSSTRCATARSSPSPTPSG